MAEVRLDGVTKSFGDVPAVRGIDLTMEDGTFTVLLGPSGCGKTTTLNLIAGLEEVDGGRIHFDGQAVQDRPPHKRDIAMVFQSYALYPNRSVRDNIGFGLRIGKVPKDEIKRRTAEAATRLDIIDLLDRRPRELSGGQQQRVALARAIVRRPAVFLLDEPLSNLDAKLRADMRVGLKALQQELSATFVYVTHDQTEAMSMADRVIVMEGGRVQQAASPLDLYKRPVNRFVASFVGSPSMNQLEGEVDGRGVFHCGPWSCPVPGPSPSGPAVLGVRAEGVNLAPAADGPGQVRVIERLGVESLVAVAMPFGDITARTTADTELAPDARVSVELTPAEIHLFSPETGERLDAARTADPAAR